MINLDDRLRVTRFYIFAFRKFW